MTIECGLTNKHALNNQVHLHVILAFVTLVRSRIHLAHTSTMEVEEEVQADISNNVNTSSFDYKSCFNT